ncbi:MAG: hypothetical protein WBF43_03130 [Methylocella sp.]
MLELEEFCKAHEHTIAALGAISTFLAVIVSLVLAFASRRASRTQVNACALICSIDHPTLDRKNRPKYVRVDVRNTGIMPVMIPFSFFYWRMPFRRSMWIAIPLDFSQTDKWVRQKTYPVEIKPRASESFFVSVISRLRCNFRDDIFAGANFLDRCRFYFLSARLVTDDGKIFNVKMGRTLRKELRALLGNTVQARNIGTSQPPPANEALPPPADE